MSQMKSGWLVAEDPGKDFGGMFIGGWVGNVLGWRIEQPMAGVAKTKTLLKLQLYQDLTLI